jgi:Ca-activated chloride channel family protein
MNTIQLQYPYLLFLLLIVPVYLMLRIRSIKSSSIAYAPLQYIRKKKRLAILPFIPLFFEVLIYVVLVAAIAVPHTTYSRTNVSDEGVDIALALDISYSMQADDFEPNRLEATKNIASEFVKKSSSDRISVYAFAANAYAQSLLSTDRTMSLNLIDSISEYSVDHYNYGGTAIGDALLLSARALLNARIEGRSQAVILISDGESNHGIDPVVAAKYLKENNIRLYVIGVGENKLVVVHENLSTKLDDTQLKSIAAAGGGSYYRATNADVLKSIFNKIDQLEKTPLEVNTIDYNFSYTPYISLVILALFVLNFLIQFLIIRRPYR